MSDKDFKLNTKMMHWGRDPSAYYGLVNPPIARTSTILYPNLAAYEDPNHRYRYGRMGNPMSDAFETAMAELEGGYKAVATQSGLSAITLALLALLKGGDHILMADTVYPPLRDFCGNVLKRMGVDVEYYDPCLGGGIENLIKPETTVIYLESPGSGTFEVQDMPAIAAVAKKHDIKTIADNTWAAGVLCNPIKLGVNYALQSATKYIGGHSDINLGFVVADTAENFLPIRKTAWDMGVTAAAEDMYLALRGLRTLTNRMKQNEKSLYQVLDFLEDRQEIEKIYCPALESHSTHDIWKRDFKGVNGLLSILLKPYPKEKVHKFIDSLTLFPIGSSWGGYESLCQPQFLQHYRSAVPWKEEGYLFRFQIGLEDPEDLMADFEQAFKVLSA